jgi:hypothetical protein
MPTLSAAPPTATEIVPLIPGGGPVLAVTDDGEAPRYAPVRDAAAMIALASDARVILYCARGGPLSQAASAPHRHSRQRRSPRSRSRFCSPQFGTNWRCRPRREGATVRRVARVVPRRSTPSVGLEPAIKGLDIGTAGVYIPSHDIASRAIRP